MLENAHSVISVLLIALIAIGSVGMKSSLRRKANGR